MRIPWNKKDKPLVVREALEAGATRIVAGGGDGTLNAVADALVGDGSRPPGAMMGVLPLGTANDFAHGLGLPVDDLGKCLEIACTAPGRPIDVGRMNGESFINVASGGFGAFITATTPVAMKRALGGGAYTLMGMVKAVNLTPYRSRLLVPGEDPAEGTWLFAAVGNNRLAGGGFEVAPRAELDDGLLDLAVITTGPQANLRKLARESRTPDDAGNQVLYYRQMAEFTVESDEKLHFNLDGEPVRKKKLRFSVLPRHLEVAY